MKLLQASIRFKLPDDFEGTTADALRLAADFLDDPSTGIDDLPATASWGAGFAMFRSNAALGIRLTGSAGIFEATDPTWRWTRTDRMDLPRVHWSDQSMIK